MPKFVTLKLLPASGTVVAAQGGAPLTIVAQVVNSAAGVKPLALRVKVTYSLGGAQVVEQADVKSFPAWC